MWKGIFVKKTRPLVDNFFPWLILFLMVGTTPVMGQPIGEKGGFWLITPEEGAMAPAFVDPHGVRDRGLFSSDSVEQNKGPVIKMEKPNVDDVVASPLEIVIQFSPREASVDLSTLKVTLVKFIDIDLTDRVRPYVSNEGLHIPDAQLPSGEHTVRVTLGDTDGGLTVTQLYVKIM